MIRWRTVSLRPFLRVAMLVAILVLAAEVRSEDGAVMRFPIVGKTRFPSGLQMEVDTRWVEAQGYRPIRIKLGTSPPLPAPADRTIRVDIKTFSRGNSAEEAGDLTTAYVTLPQGKQSIATSIPVRQEALWNYLEVECFEGGMQLKDMSGSFSASASARRINQGYGWDQDAICFLVVNSQVPTRDNRTAGTTGATPTPVPKTASTADPAQPNLIPDLRALALQIPDPVAAFNYYRGNGQPAVNLADDPNNPLKDSELIDWLATRSNFEMIPPAEVPTQWLELTGFDFLILSFTELEGLSKSSPKRMQAIRDWAHSGGNLIIYGTGPDANRQTDIDQLMDKAASNGEWKSVAPSNKTTNLEFVSESTSIYGYNNGQDQNTKIDISKDKTTTGYFTVSARPSGLGFILAIQESDVFPGTRRQWTALINSIPSWRSLWSIRNGVSLSDSNADSYWNFAIPGFGLAPVMLFVALITIFVIILGPVNYSWLKRRNQLSLLIFTVPFGALITIFSLTSYALLGDGVKTRVRTWSVTELDQRTGRGTSLSHQTYYAGIPPWGGLEFPADAAVYPVDQLPEHMGGNGDFEMKRPSRLARWDRGQQLTRGFISSRTLSQMVVIRPIQVDQKLEIKDGKVTNHFEGAIKHLMMRGDEDGQLLYCADLPPGATATLQPMAEAAKNQVKEFIAANKPQPMKNFDSAAYASAIMGGSSRNRWWTAQRNYTVTAEGDGMLLEEMKQFEDPIRTQSQLPRRTFIAFTDKAVGMPLGVQSPVDILSLHLIRGKW